MGSRKKHKSMGYAALRKQMQPLPKTLVGKGCIQNLRE